MQLKNEALSLIDAIAPPDHILRSPLGQSDGKVRIISLYNNYNN